MSALPMVSPGVQRELQEVTANELFVSNGFDSVAGFPLPNGQLPVGTHALGMVLMSADAWQEYRELCGWHRTMREVHAA